MGGWETKGSAGAVELATTAVAVVAAAGCCCCSCSSCDSTIFTVAGSGSARGASSNKVSSSSSPSSYFTLNSVPAPFESRHLRTWPLNFPGWPGNTLATVKPSHCFLLRLLRTKAHSPLRCSNSCSAMRANLGTICLARYCLVSNSNAAFSAASASSNGAVSSALKAFQATDMFLLNKKEGDSAEVEDCFPGSAPSPVSALSPPASSGPSFLSVSSFLLLRPPFFFGLGDFFPPPSPPFAAAAAAASLLFKVRKRWYAVGGFLGVKSGISSSALHCAVKKSKFGTFRLLKVKANATPLAAEKGTPQEPSSTSSSPPPSPPPKSALRVRFFRGGFFTAASVPLTLLRLGLLRCCSESCDVFR
mmetsp:Transcript_20393/g.41753  ORF Transcript_20393/g.41753 Transcript_20393/m.41753 type:complete len:361 (+) Transcript_20393:371-1453(+)